MNERQMAAKIDSAVKRKKLTPTQISDVIRQNTSCQFGGCIWPGNREAGQLGVTFCTIDRQRLGLLPIDKYKKISEIYPDPATNIPKECITCPVFFITLNQLSAMVSKRQ